MVETNSWVVVEANLVPFLLRSVYHSLGTLQNEELETNMFGHLELDKEHFEYPTWSLPLPISCHILALMLDVTLSNQKIAVVSESVASNGHVDSQCFSGNLIWSLCSMAERMLLQSLEHRSSAISFLLPIIFKAFSSFLSFEVSVHGRKCMLSRYCLQLLPNVFVLYISSLTILCIYSVYSFDILSIFDRYPGTVSF